MPETSRPGTNLEVSLFNFVNVSRNFTLLSDVLIKVEDLLERELQSIKPLTFEELKAFFQSQVPPGEEPYNDDQIAQRIRELSQGEEIYGDDAVAFEFPVKVRHALVSISYGYLEVELKRLLAIVSPSESSGRSVHRLVGKDLLTQAIRSLSSFTDREPQGFQEIDYLRLLRNCIMHSNATLAEGDSDHAAVRRYLGTKSQHVDSAGAFRLTREFCAAALRQMQEFVLDCL